MIKTFYMSYTDLDYQVQNDIDSEIEQYVRDELKTEAHNMEDWKPFIMELYSFDTDQDLENFVTTKAKDIITSAFRKIPVNIEVEFK